MGNGTKILARAALIAALGCVILYIAAVVPTGRIALIAIAGMLTAAAVIHCGMGAAIAVFAVTALIGFLILPQKSGVALYTVFFGYYPILKSLLERLSGRGLSWALKYIVFNIAFALTVFLGKETIAAGVDNFAVMWVAAQLVGNVVFLAYDICLSKLIETYILRVSRHVR